jgi:modulator of FtsH protease
MRERAASIGTARVRGTDAQGWVPMLAAWKDFFVATAGAAAALTGLLFIAVSLRPSEIRHSQLMVGRARSAFYAFATIAFVSLLALAGTDSRLIGGAELGVAVAAVVLSAPFTLAAMRAHRLNYWRASAYHAGLLIVAAAGVVRAAGGDARDSSALLATGVLILLGIALSNSWQLVITHEADDAAQS